LLSYVPKSLFSCHRLTFSRRHERTHTRPYQCRRMQGCNFRCAELRDRRRHEATHGMPAQGGPQFYCPHNCDWDVNGSEGGFGIREDNAKRHINKKHPGSTLLPIRI
jgi:hypothetical protein